MPENLEPNLTPEEVEGGAVPAEDVGTPAPQPSVYEELRTKKGFKTEEELAKIYVDAEKSLGKHQNITTKVKQQLQAAGYTIDDEGNVVASAPVDSGFPGVPGVPGTPGAPATPGEPIYDPYTGAQITDPIAIQLARMPVGHREAFIVNAILNQRDTQQESSIQAEVDILSKPEAKDFADDVKSVMQRLPLAQRADKKAWEDALLKVKGMRYDEALKNAGKEGVTSYLNKAGNQTPAGGGGGGGAVALSSEQEQTYSYYQKNYPTMFKDKAHFLRATRPDGGR